MTTSNGKAETVIKNANILTMDTKGIRFRINYTS